MKERKEVGNLRARDALKGTRFRTHGKICGARDWVVVRADHYNGVLTFRALSADGGDWISLAMGTDILGSELR